MDGYNHEVKNTESDSAGFLIDKFDSTGRIIISVYVDVFTHKISFQLKSNTKDLFEHLLKPATSFSLVMADTEISSDTGVVLSPIVFPTGFVESVTFMSKDFSKLASFELACYGNEKNEITGAKRWFYVSSEMLEYDGNCSYCVKNNEYIAIVPYSFNFLAAKFKFKAGGSILGKLLNSVNANRLKELDYQYVTDFVLGTTTEIPDTLTKTQVTSIPFVQFNILKAT